MSASDLIRPEEISFGAAPVEQSYTGFWDIVKASMDNQKASENFASYDTVVFNKTNEAVESYVRETGNTSPFVQSGTDGVMQLWSEKIDKEIEQGRLEGKQEYFRIPTSSEIRSNAEEEMAGLKIDYEDVLSRAAPDAWKGTASFLGSAAGWLQDPTQVLSMGIGGTTLAAKLGGGVVNMMLAEGAVALATEAVTQVPVYQGKKKAGILSTEGTLDKTFFEGANDAVENILFAGLGAAGITGGLHAAIKMATIGKYGFTADETRRLFGIYDQALKNERPRDGMDFPSEQAHQANLEYASREIDLGKMPQPEKFDKRSVPKKFDEDAVTLDHADVARDLIERQVKKSNIDGELRKPFMDELRAEYEMASKLNKVDVEKTKADVVDATKAIEQLNAEIKSAVAKGRELSSRELKNEDQVRMISELENSVESMMARKAKLLSKKASATKKLDNHVRAVEAADGLAALDAGRIPEWEAKRYSAYKKNVKNAMIDITEYENAMRDFADKVFAKQAGDFFMPSFKRVNDLEVMEKASEITDSPDYKKSVDNEFDKMVSSAVTGDDTGKYAIMNEEGDIVEMGIKEIDEKFAEDASTIKALRSCLVGGK